MGQLNYNWDVARVNMRKLREKKQLSQLALHIELGWCEGSISNYESGKNIPSIEYIIAFCTYFEIRIEELFEEDLIKEKKH